MLFFEIVGFAFMAGCGLAAFLAPIVVLFRVVEGSRSEPEEKER